MPRIEFGWEERGAQLGTRRGDAIGQAENPRVTGKSLGSTQATQRGDAIGQVEDPRVTEKNLWLSSENAEGGFHRSTGCGCGPARWHTCPYESGCITRLARVVPLERYGKPLMGA